MGHIFEITVMRLAPPLESIRWFERALRKLGLTSDALALACVCVRKFLSAGEARYRALCGL